LEDVQNVFLGRWLLFNGRVVADFDLRESLSVRIAVLSTLLRIRIICGDFTIRIRNVSLYVDRHI